MRVAVISYPILFQTSGGLKMKVNRTVEALNRAGIDARLIDPVRERFTDYDLVHVFACHQGNFRIIQQAKGDGLPVVVSTILNPPFSLWDGVLASQLSRLVGRLTNRAVSTSYEQIKVGLDLADKLIALGKIERQMLIEGYSIASKKVSIIHNGIGEEFFNTGPELFEQTFSIPKPFVLHTGIICDTKNQLGLIRALKNDESIHIVLIGPSNKASDGYLQECLALGGDRVHYLGELEHGQLIASAYSAASVIAVPSQHEGMPNTILEALASDKPAVMTNRHTVDIDLPSDVVKQVSYSDIQAIRDGVLGLIKQSIPKGRCRSVVESLSWGAVAEQLASIYKELM
jgi:glycosyltransferase involved in cell wall biosynthesis